MFRTRKGCAGIGGGVRHDESGAALFVQRGVEMLYPDGVAIVGARNAQGGARIFDEALLTDLFECAGMEEGERGTTDERG